MENINIYLNTALCLEQSKNPSSWTTWLLRNGPTACLKTCVYYQHMLHNIPEVWSPHTTHYLGISSQWMDDSFRCKVLPFPPPITSTISLGINTTGERSISIVHGDTNETNMPRRIHGNAAPRSATCFLWHVASGTPELWLKSRVTWMYRSALCRILRLEDFFSSWETGNCRFKSSKHSFRCARRFFSSLLWTSRVPALKQDSIITLSH